MMIFLNALLCQWILSRLGKCSIFISSSDPQSALKSTNFELPFLPFGCLSVTNSKHDMTCPSPFLNSNRYSDIFNQSICSFLVPPMLYSAFFPHFSLCIKLFSKYFKAPSFTYFKNKYIHLILLFYIFFYGEVCTKCSSYILHICIPLWCQPFHYWSIFVIVPNNYQTLIFFSSYSFSSIFSE